MTGVTWAELDGWQSNMTAHAALVTQHKPRSSIWTTQQGFPMADAAGTAAMAAGTAAVAADAAAVAVPDWQLLMKG